MKKVESFEVAIENNLGKLRAFVPIVARVHGPSHPEFYEVKEVFETLNAKIDASDTKLDNEFSKLRSITSDYLVPSDTCESYEAVYNMLEELDESYHK